MPHDPYAVLRALLRAEAARRTTKAPGTGTPPVPSGPRPTAREGTRD